MSMTRRQKRTIRTCLGLILAYAVVFVGVNFQLISHKIDDSLVPLSQKEEVAGIDPEAIFDEEYFNSPQVERAMSLDEPVPYNVLERDSHDVPVGI